MSEPAIIVENLSKRYRIGEQQTGYKTIRETLVNSFKGIIYRSQFRPTNTIWALKNVSLIVQPGDVLGIIGRNGAGKSTLLKILSRITKPTEGHARVYGRVGSLLEVGTGFHPELTGRENIYLNGAIIGMRRNEIAAKFDEIVAFSEIEKFLDTPVKRYSSGMYIRLAFAVAAHLEPEILLVDEVLAVGDAAFQKKCLGKMSQVAGGGRTVLFVSHNMSSIQSLCERCILLENGHITTSGPTLSVIEAYLQNIIVRTENKEVGVFELTNRKNAYTPDQIMIKKVRLRDMKGTLQNQFRMGESFQVEVLIEGDLNSIVGITLKTKDDLWIGSINTAMTGLDTSSFPNDGSGWFVCNIKTLPLNPGRYALAVSVTKNWHRTDYVEIAATFDVIENDIYGSGYPIESKYGIIYLQGKWDFTQSTGE